MPKGVGSAPDGAGVPARCLLLGGTTAIVGFVNDGDLPRSLTVLVVALDATAGRAFAARLAGEGVHVITSDASDPAAAVAAAKRTGARVALVDLGLPHAGALAILSALASFPGVAPLAFTARDAPRTLRPALERGAQGSLAGACRHAASRSPCAPPHGASRCCGRRSPASSCASSRRPARAHARWMSAASRAASARCSACSRRAAVPTRWRAI